MRSDGSRLLGDVSLTRRQIATRIGVSHVTVAMWISGQRIPNEEHRKSLQAAFGISINAWPGDWQSVRDVIIAKLVLKAPDLLREIADELEAIESGSK